MIMLKALGCINIPHSSFLIHINYPCKHTTLVPRIVLQNFKCVPKSQRNVFACFGAVVKLFKVYFTLPKYVFTAHTTILKKYLA